MTDNLFDNAKFGDMFLTTENKQAVFLRFAENAEYKFAILYVEDWGNVQVFRHNGKAIYNDAAHSIISKKEEPVSEDLEEEINRYLSYRSSSPQNPIEFNRDLARHFANWQKQQMMKEPVSEDFEEQVKSLWKEVNTGHTYSVIDSYNIFYGVCLDIATWQKEQYEKERLKHCDELK